MVGMGSPLAAPAPAQPAPAQAAPAPAAPAPNPAAQSAAGAGVTPNEFAIAVPPTRPSQPAIPKPVLPAVVIADGASATVPDPAAKPSGGDVENAASAAFGARLALPPAVDLGDETVQLYGLKKSGGTGIFIGVGVAAVAAIGLWFATQKSDKPAVAPASTPIKAAAEQVPPPPPATPEPVAAPPPTPKAVATAPAPTAETKPAAAPEPPVAKPASLAAAPPPAANPPPAKTREAAPPPVAKPAPPPPPAPKPAAHKPAPSPATPTPGKPGGIVREVPF
jgi:hypothetical protein